MSSPRLLSFALVACSGVLAFAQETALPSGLTLPSSGTVFSMSTGATTPELVQLHPSEIVSNSHAASNFARSMVYSGPRASVELAGLNAATHLAGDKPSFLVRLNVDDPELLRGRVSLIRMKQTKDRRVVSTYAQNVFGGQRTRTYDVVPVTKVDVAEGKWLKLTPEAPLTPGEYGIIFLPKDAMLFPDAVYDFDVDFSAAKPER